MWYSGIKRKMTRLIFQRKLALAQSMDTSPNELYAEHIRQMTAALSRANTAESAMRKAVLQMLWRCAGRGSEPGALAYGGLMMNLQFNTPTLEAPQSKASKLKRIPLVAGANRHMDALLHLGDHWVLQRGSVMYDTEQKCFFFEELGATGGSSKITDWIKGLQPEGRPGSVAKYAFPPSPPKHPAPCQQRGLGKMPKLGPTLPGFGPQYSSADSFSPPLLRPPSPCLSNKCALPPPCTLGTAASLWRRCPLHQPLLACDRVLQTPSRPPVPPRSRSTPRAMT